MKRRLPTYLLPVLLLSLLSVLMTSSPATASGPSSQPPLLVRWRGADSNFSTWELHNLQLSGSGALTLPPAAAGSAPGDLRVGEAISPILDSLSFEEAIVSWNGTAPLGTWMDVLLRVEHGGTWSDWYYMGIWSAAEGGTVRRQSVANQEEAALRIAVDTLVMKVGRAGGAQLKLRLFSEQAGVVPTVQNVALSLSDHPRAEPTLSSGDPEMWGRALPVPPCSQMDYPDGGEIWCSPTSVSMVLRYWAQERGEPIGDCEPWVRQAVAGVYDFVYDGHGNWPFNVAYASTQGMEGVVTRLRGLDEAEWWIARGVPVVVSFGWRPGELDGAPLPSSAGHLAVLSGFDSDGNPIVHDPAASPAANVPRTYRRDQFERLWLSRTGGTVYLIAPPERFAPAHRLYVPLVSGPGD